MQKRRLGSTVWFASAVLCAAVLLSVSSPALSQSRVTVAKKPAAYEVKLNTGKKLEATQVRKSGEYYLVTLTDGSTVNIKISEAKVKRMKIGTTQQKTLLETQRKPGPAPDTKKEVTVEYRVAQLENKVTALKAQVAALMEIIEIQDSRVVLDTGGKDLEIASKDLSIESDGELKLESGKGLEISSGIDLKLKSGTNLKVESGLDLQLKSLARAKLEGGTSVEVESSAGLGLKGAVTTIDGGTIVLNGGDKFLSYGMINLVGPSHFLSGPPAILVP